jgi:hypothetical protein
MLFEANNLMTSAPSAASFRTCCRIASGVPDCSLSDEIEVSRRGPGAPRSMAARSSRSIGAPML